MTLRLPTLHITDSSTQRTFRLIEEAVNAANDAIDAIEDRVTTVEAGVSSVTSGSPELTASPTTGDVVLTLDLSAYPTGSGTSGRSTRWTGASSVGTGAFLDDGTNASLAGTLTLSALTAGSVLFVGSGGLVSQDNANLFWDDANNRLGVGTNTPESAALIHAKASASGASAAATGSVLVGERNGAVYLTLKGPAGTEKGLMFNNPSGAGDGSVLYDHSTLARGLQFRTGGNSTSAMVIRSNGVVVVGANDLTNAGFTSTFEITRNTSNSVNVTAYGTGINSELMLFRARGTAGSSSAVQSGDQLGQIAFTGATGSGSGQYFSSCLISGVASQNFNTTTNFGAGLNFYTTTNGTGSGGRAARLTIDHDGTATFKNDLHVDGGVYLGDTAADAHTLLGTLNANSTAGSNGEVLKVVSGVPKWSSVLADGDYGDITVSASGATWTIDNDVVTYAKLQNVSATNRVMGRITAGAGDMEELTGTQVTSLLDAYAGSSAGLVPTGTGTTTRYLREDGTWAIPPGTGGGGATLADGDYGDITVSGTGAVLTIDNDVVTYAKMQDVSATNRFLGRITSGAGDTEELTGTQATTLLDVVSTSAKGLVPTAPNDATQYLDGTGAWSVPGGAGSVVFSGASVHNNGGSVSVATSTDTALTHNTEAYDTDSYHDTSSNTSRLTAPFTGYYRVSIHLRFIANSSGYRRLYFRVNGSTEHGRVQIPANGANELFPYNSVVISMTAGDYVEAVIWQNSGSSLNCYTATYAPFQIEYLGS